MEASQQRSALALLLDALEGAVVSAIAAGVIGLGLSFAIGSLFMMSPGVTDSLEAVWILPLAPVAGTLAAVIGAVLAVRARPVAPLPWIIATVVGILVALAIGFSLQMMMPLGTLFTLTSALAVALLLPIGTATSVRVLLALRGPAARRTTRVVLALALVAAGGAFYVHRHRAIRDETFTHVAVGAGGRVYVATSQARVLSADPDTLEWRELPRIRGARYISSILPLPEPPGYLLACAESQLWQYAPDRGSWAKLPGGMAGVAVTAVAAAPHGVYLVDRFGGLHTMRPDRGNVWEKRAIAVPDQGIVSPQHVAVSPDHPGSVVCGSEYGGGLIHTRDYGDSWQTFEMPRGAGGAFGDAVSDVAFLNGDPPEILVVLDCGLFLSTDEGVTWREIQTPEKMFLGGQIAVAEDGGRTLYLRAGLDLYASDDLGKTWWSTGVHRITDGLGIIMSMAVDPTDPQRVYVARSKALYRTVDGGHTWKRIR